MMSKTHFGFKEVDETQKQGLVGQVFSSVASKYDVMNDFMSVGLHRLWKDQMVKILAPQSGMKYLDVAGGSGDISIRVWKKGAEVTLTDINPDMLEQGKKRAVDNNIIERINFDILNAEEMQFADESFDISGIAFGIRNVTHIDKALTEFYRVLKKGGKFVCLEFSDVENPILSKLYDAYSFNVIPKMGSLVAGDEASYQYLVESIRKFPKARDFENMIKNAGFKNTGYKKLNHGVVAIHWGSKV